MDKRCEQTLHERRYMDGKWAHEKLKSAAIKEVKIKTTMRHITPTSREDKT